MRVRDLYIGGLGSFVPATVSVRWAVEQGFCPPDVADKQGWTGVAVAGDLSAPEMALQAVREALRRGDCAPRDVDLLLYPDCWHQGPDGWQPQYYLQRHLLGGDVLAVELRHGCNGMFSALELAASYLLADQARSTALIAASDNFGTPLIDRWMPGPGFVAGDAAVALTLTKTPAFAQLLSVATTTIPEIEEMHRCGEPLFPPGATTGRPVRFTDRIEAFKHKLVTEGWGTAALLSAQRRMLECVERTLSEADITVQDIARVGITHSSREEAEENFMGAVALPLKVSTWEFGRTVGHLGAADHMVALEHLVATGQLGAGEHYFMIGVAPGITYSCAVIKILEAPSWSRPESADEGVSS